jgi:hemolysin III
MSQIKRTQTTLEEVGNAISHGLGVLLGVGMMVCAVLLSTEPYLGAKIFTGILFGITLVLLYLSSTLYHSLSHQGAKALFKIFDHASIYLLIAGSYSPFLVVLPAKYSIPLGGAVWGLALFGILFKVFYAGRFKKLSTAIYILMGWLAVTIAGPLLELFTMEQLSLVVAGGLAYTLGAVFYLFDRIPAFHFVWHLFVLAGSCLHVLAVVLHVLPWSGTPAV